MFVITKKELSEKLGVSESTITSQFPRLQAKYKMQGITIYKLGRGEKADYQLIYDIEDDKRANTIFEETKTELVVFDEDILSLSELQFFIFAAIASTPMCVFRGRYKDFLNYIGKQTSEKNIISLKEGLKELLNRKMIQYFPDNTNDEIFIAAFYSKTEDKAKIGIELIKECKRISDKYLEEDNIKYNFISLIKIWIATQLAISNQPYSLTEISAKTGLAENTIKKYNEILEKEGVYKSKKIYDGFYCKGRITDLNAFFNKT